jgi:TPR repeat protein
MLFISRRLSRTIFATSGNLRPSSPAARSTLNLSSRTQHFPNLLSRRWATSVTPHSSASDPAEAEAARCLEQGTAKLEEGDVQAAKGLYKRSAEIKKNASSLFNLGVTHYHLSPSFFSLGQYKPADTRKHQRNTTTRFQRGKSQLRSNRPVRMHIPVRCHFFQ